MFLILSGRCAPTARMGRRKASAALPARAIHCWAEWRRGAALAAMLPLLILVGCLPVAAPTDATAPREVLVFAAASLTDAMNQVAQEFETANPGVEVVTNFGGSSGLATQILEGGVADVFAAANQTQMQRVVEAGLAAAEPTFFATNRLVVILPADNPGGVETLADLATPGLRLVLAIPGVPVRDYTDTMLAAMAADDTYGPDYTAGVYANLVSEEDNVRQVVAKVALGEADIGVVYSSDVMPEMADGLRTIPVPDPFNVVAAYPVAPLADAPHPDLAQAFVKFLLAERGQAILQAWGFGPAPQ